MYCSLASTRAPGYIGYAVAVHYDSGASCPQKVRCDAYHNVRSNLKYEASKSRLAWSTTDYWQVMAPLPLHRVLHLQSNAPGERVSEPSHQQHALGQYSPGKH